MSKDGASRHNLDGCDEEEGRGKYAVLGWYRVRDAWEELEPGVQSNGEVRLFVRCKFAFEWVETQGIPWWVKDVEKAYSVWLSLFTIPQIIPSGGVSSSHRVSEPLQCQHISAIDLWTSEHYEEPPGLNMADLHPPLSPYRCAKCAEMSPLIYHEGWFCTNAKCPQMGLVSASFADSSTLTDFCSYSTAALRQK
jgi:hypothetical protein